jgi:hypothetical protein
MNRIAIYKTMPEVMFAEVTAEIKQRYPGLNMKTASGEFIDLMAVISRHVQTDEGRKKIVAKILMASLISDCFTQPRKN